MHSHATPTLRNSSTTLKNGLNSAVNRFDAAVVGGGMIGVAIAYGLARSGVHTALFDEGDVAFRAARGNFGLIWVQGKGCDSPAYAKLTQRSANIWERFNSEIEEVSGIHTEYHRPGGMHLCLTEQEFQQQAHSLSRLADFSGGRFRYKMMRRGALLERLPGIGPDVVGASFSPSDGHVNPLLLLRALHTAFKRKGGELRHETVVDIQHHEQKFGIRTTSGLRIADKIVLAAGLSNTQLAQKIGLQVPVRPQRGQILVTERLKPFLHYPTSLVRQTADGSVMLGDSHEETGFDDGTSIAGMASIADRANRIYPQLGNAGIVRAWGALRILTPDGLPIYAQSNQYPGAFAATSHSGVTLAAVHARDIALYVEQGELPATLSALSEKRFQA